MGNRKLCLSVRKRNIFAVSPTQTFKILMPVVVAGPTKAAAHLTRVVGVVGHLVGPEEEAEAVTSPLDRTTPEHKVIFCANEKDFLQAPDLGILEY